MKKTGPFRDKGGAPKVSSMPASEQAKPIRLRKIVFPLVFVVSAGFLRLHGPGSMPAEAAADFKWTAICRYTRSAQVDPIVSPGRTSSHLHDFFGTAPAAEATYDSLRASDTTCTLAEDTAGYWAPSLYTKNNNGRYVQRLPSRAHAYYTRRGSGDPPVQPFPPNLKMVAGNSDASPKSQTTRVAWFDCGPGNGPWSPPAQAPYLCPKDKKVRAHVRFPSCWDGTMPSAKGDDSAHMAYPTRNACPAGWIKVPQIHLLISYSIQDGRGARLSSGGGPAVANSIYTLHADYFHAWDQKAHSLLVDECLNGSAGPCGSPSTPVVKRFSPASGSPGTNVSVTGRYFNGAKSVTVGGVWAPFTVVSSSEMVFTVPAGARSGPIAVTSGGQTSMDLSTTGYSSEPFTVK